MFALIQTFVDRIDRLGDNPLLAYMFIFSVLVITGAGLPVTEELLVITGGFLLQQYQCADPAQEPFRWYWMFLVCYVGILIADMIIYWVGSKFGKAVLHRRWVKRAIHPRRLLWARHRMAEYGVTMVVASRFIPASRYGVMLLAGMMHMKWWKFFLADGISAIFSVALQLWLGWWLGRLFTNINDVVKHRGLVTLIMLGIGLAIVLIYMIWHRWHAHRKEAAEVEAGDAGDAVVE